MSDIAVLKAMIQDHAKVPLEINQYGKKKVVLAESDKYSITINDMPKDDEVIIIKADIFGPPDEIFKGNKGECKRADFVIVANTDGKKFILCIEMKAGKGGGEAGIIQQLKGAKCFVVYCQEIGQLFWKNKDFLKDYEYRFVSIKKISIAKKETRNKNAPLHDQPDNMLKISSPSHLTFNRLV
jgi:hypothetical protein